MESTSAPVSRTEITSEISWRCKFFGSLVHVVKILISLNINQGLLKPDTENIWTQEEKIFETWHFSSRYRTDIIKTVARLLTKYELLFCGNTRAQTKTDLEIGLKPEKLSIIPCLLARMQDKVGI
jgi:hypothetical protein